MFSTSGWSAKWLGAYQFRRLNDWIHSQRFLFHQSPFWNSNIQLPISTLWLWLCWTTKLNQTQSPDWVGWEKSSAPFSLSDYTRIYDSRQMNYGIFMWGSFSYLYGHISKLQEFPVILGIRGATLVVRKRQSEKRGNMSLADHQQTLR